MAIQTETAASKAPAAEKIPPLENGDRLTRPEFERRYDAMPALTIAELIEGKAYLPSPVSVDQDGPHFDLITWLGTYRVATPGGRGGDNGSLRLDLHNMPQPDAYLMILPTHGGQARIGAARYVEGAPELIAEVAASTVSYDPHDKLDAYRRNEVREYVVWRVLDQAIDWFVLREGRYEPLLVDEAGFYKSELFAGLWLDPAALVRGDMVTVLQSLQQGLASRGHAAFVAHLPQAKE